MGEQQIPTRNRGYPLGVNNKLFAYDINDQEAVELQNIDTSTPAISQKRKGSTLTATGITLGPIKALGFFTPNTKGGEEARVLAVSPNGDDGHYRLWEWDGTGSTFSEVGTLSGMTGAVTDIKITQIYDLVSAAATFPNRHIAIISADNGHGANVRRYAYDGTTLTQTWWGSSDFASSYPSSAIMESAYYRLFGAGSGDAKNRVFYFDVGSGAVTGVQNTQSFVFGGSSSGDVVEIKQYRPNAILVFLSDKIEALLVNDALTDQTTALDVFRAADAAFRWNREVIDPQIGCGARKTVQTTGEDVFFVDQYGNVRSIAQTIADSRSGTRSLPVSDKIQGYIDRINGAYLSTAAAISFDRFYFLALPLDSATTPSHIFRFDTTRRAWDGPWTGLDPNLFTVGLFSASGAAAADKVPTIFMATNEATFGEIVRLERGAADQGSSIEYKETTKRYTLGNLELEKRWTRLIVFAVGTANDTLTVEANPGGLGWQTLGTMSILGGAPTLPVGLTFVLGGSGVASKKFSLEGLQPSIDIQFRFTSDTTEVVKILGFSFLAYVENFEWGEVTN